MRYRFNYDTNKQSYLPVVAETRELTYIIMTVGNGDPWATSLVSPHSILKKDILSFGKESYEVVDRWDYPQGVIFIRVKEVSYES